MVILDAHGRPFEKTTLAEPQTARLTHLHRQIANHQARGLTPARLNAILQDAEAGHLTAQHELFADMEERDAHIYSEMDKRKRVVCKSDWTIHPPRNPSKEEEALAAYAEELLSELPDFEDTCRDLLDAIGHGFSALEIEWQRVGRDWTMGALNHRPQSWFQLDIETRTQLRLRDLTPNGADLTPFGWVLHTHRAKSGYIARGGLHRVLVWPFLFKAYAIGDLAEFVEIYGLPLRLGKYPATATDDEKMTLLRAVMGIGHNAAGIIPQGMSIDFMEAAKGQADPFECLLSWADRSSSKAIVGQTLSADSASTGLGSGVAELHREVRQDIRESDAKQLAGTITRQIIYPLLAINKGLADPRRCPRFSFDVQQPEDIAKYAEALPKLAGLNLRIGIKHVHDKLNIPVAAEGEEILRLSPAKTAQETGKPLQQALRMAMLRQSATAASGTADDPAYADQDALDGALANIDLAAATQALIGRAVAALTQAGSYEDALAMLEAETPLADVETLGAALGRAMFAAEMQGYASVREEVRDDLAQQQARQQAQQAQAGVQTLAEAIVKQGEAFQTGLTALAAAKQDIHVHAPTQVDVHPTTPGSFSEDVERDDRGLIIKRTRKEV